jgi:hypothetical protein
MSHTKPNAFDGWISDVPVGEATRSMCCVPASTTASIRRDRPWSRQNARGSHQHMTPVVRTIRQDRLERGLRWQTFTAMSNSWPIICDGCIKPCRRSTISSSSCVPTLRSKPSVKWRRCSSVRYPSCATSWLPRRPLRDATSIRGHLQIPPHQRDGRTVCSATPTDVERWPGLPSRSQSLPKIALAVRHALGRGEP